MERNLPNGVGLGLRWAFLDELLEREQRAEVAFLEVSPENYMRRGGYIPAALERLRERYALSTHGLTLSIGAVDAPDAAYLRELRRETERLGVPFHSDHLCFSSAGPRVLHDLLPLKLARSTVERVADRVRAVEDTLGLPLVLENISYYVQPGAVELPETEFLAQVLERSGARLLLDVNNVWVNSVNHGFDPRAFIEALPLERVAEIHIAGHLRTASGLVIDTHGAPVIDPVKELLAFTLARTGPRPVLLERDHHVPPLEELLAEVSALQAVYDRAVAAPAERP